MAWRRPRRCREAAVRRLGVLLTALGLAASAWSAGAGFSERRLPASTAGMALSAWMRPALLTPQRYRVIVLPGSGCRGWAPEAEAMFAGLAHAELWLLHKPLVRPWAGVSAADCPPAFVQRDRLVSWLADARAALAAIAADPRHQPIPPTLLVAFSEGADLLPHLADDVPALRGLVMIGAAGLDAGEVGELQSAALGELAAWRRVREAAASARADGDVLDGRSLGYWRDLLAWRSADLLLRSPVDLLSVWGSRDEAIPQTAFRRFTEQAALHRPESYCWRAVGGADHSLQSPRGDHLQEVWAGLEAWAREPGQRLCIAWQRP